MLRVPSCYWHVKANFCVVLYFVKTDGRINGVSFQKLATCFCLLHGDKPYPTYTVQRCSWCDTQVQYVALLTHFSVSAVQIKWGNSCSGIKAQLTLSDNTTIGGRRRHWCWDFFFRFWPEVYFYTRWTEILTMVSQHELVTGFFFLRLSLLAKDTQVRSNGLIYAA